jgi:hypothetical protein
MKKLYKFFLVLLAIQAGYIIYLIDTQFFHIIFTESTIYGRNSLVFGITRLIRYTSLFIFPFLFLYSWFSEETARTNYQLYSLPRRNSVHVKSKMAAVLTLGVIWLIGWMIFASFEGVIRSTYFPYRYSSGPIPLMQHLYNIYNRYFQNVGNLFVLMGIASIVTGCVQALKRYRLVAGTVVFIALNAVYIFVITPFLIRTYEAVIIYAIRDFAQSHFLLSIYLISAMHDAVLLLSGIACIYLGFYLFERFSEV